MSVFVDTSALFALVDRRDHSHEAAVVLWDELAGTGADLVTTNYVVLEAHASFQRKFGMDVIRSFENDLLPGVVVYWIGRDTHASGVAAVLQADGRGLSLVDCTSFAFMRLMGITRAFAFDPHFAGEGFEVLPGAQGTEATPEPDG